MNDKCNIFGITINNWSWNELMENIDKAVKDRSKNKYLLTVNVDHIVKMQKDKDFYIIYKNADFITADGVPIIWISKLLKKPIKQKLSGSDILPAILPQAEKMQYRIFFLGAAKGVAERAAEKIKSKYRNIKIVGTYSPSFGFEKIKEENDKIVEMIKSANIDILFVGLGAPKQEKWIAKYKDSYNVPLSIGVGATFDFIAGNVKRAPKWVQNIGLEWFWRFLHEPRRLFKRYFVDDIKFIKICVAEYRKCHMK